MSGKMKVPRRDFLKQAAGVIGAATQSGHWTGTVQAQATPARNMGADHPLGQTEIPYPRVFEGRQLKMISFPLGGVAAGSLGLGGRGQLRDWEIFNRPSVSSPILACIRVTSTLVCCSAFSSPKTLAAPSCIRVFQSVIWLGWTSNCWASSARVLSPFRAAKATFALKAAV